MGGAAVLVVLVAGGATAGAKAPISVGPVSTVSQPCSGRNAEVAQAVDPSGTGYVYEAWLGCQGIGFSRSTNSGASFSEAVTLPGSTASQGDPAMAVAPDGTVYVAFMMLAGEQEYPYVAASFDHGVTFPQLTPVVAPDPDNWGDSPNLAVGPDGTVYLTWDYGPDSTSVSFHCSPGGSCSYTKGELNVVLQKSTDGGKTFGSMVQISPGYPWSGGDNGPVVVDRSGHVDVIYQDYPANPKTHVFGPAINYFTSSGDEGTTWSTPVPVGSGAGSMSTAEWWNEPSLGVDAGGNLYAAWDTQGQTSTGVRADVGWLSYSRDGGVTWSPPLQVPPDVKDVPHIMEVTGAASGRAYVEWLSDSSASGYALYFRSFAITGGWLTAPLRVSLAYGNRTVWPGDTFGLSILDPTHLVTSWGSGLFGTHSQSVVYAAEVTVAP